MRNRETYYMRGICSLGAVIMFVILAAVVGASPAFAQVDFLFDKGEYIANHPTSSFRPFEAGNVARGGSQICGDVVNSFTNDVLFPPADILPGLQFMTNFVGKPLYIEGEHVGGEGNPGKVLGTQTDGTNEFLEIEFPQGGVHAAGNRSGMLRRITRMRGYLLVQRVRRG